MLHQFLDGYMTKEADWKERLTEVVTNHPAVAGGIIGGAFGTGVGLLPDDES